eukprot:2924045-Rhodomonas_salina.1
MAMAANASPLAMAVLLSAMAALAALIALSSQVIARSCHRICIDRQGMRQIAPILGWWSWLDTARAGGKGEAEGFEKGRKGRN